jgi:hypothetical protein
LIPARARLARWGFIARVVGPHPIELARTFLFLASRRLRPHTGRRLYATALPSASVDLCPPAIGLARFAELPRELRPAALKIREEAEHVVAHRVDFLGSGLVELGPEIDWHRDFKSGFRWPQHFYQDLKVTRLTDQSDAKIPWELSRCHQLLTLARAARIFEQERYAREFEAQLGAWLKANPPGIGINWTNPMELGIRSVNLVWAVGTLEEWRNVEPSLRQRLTTSLRWHGHHIESNLEGAPYLRSNHYLGDLLGLLTLGSVLSGELSAHRWSAFARREFEREILKQVYPDGVSFEASLGYHGLALEMFLIASHIAACSGAPLSARFHERLTRMATVSHHVRHGDGRIPLFGDQDSGRILPATFDRPPTHDNLLWLATALGLTGGPREQMAHPEVAWTLGLQTWQKCSNLPPAPAPRSAAFPNGGIFVLRGTRSHVVARCGDVGQNGFGGHSHNDVLSYELSIDGVPLMVDSGTYAYTFDVDSRNEFRSTRAHNTVAVDGEEINPINGDLVFELRRFARPKVCALNLTGETLEFLGSHDGYRRLADPVIHRRRLSLLVSEDEFAVSDELSCATEHKVESFLHFVPGTVIDRTAETSFEVQSGAVRVTITFSGFSADDLALAKGWVSDRYGVRTRAPVLVARTRQQCQAKFGYTIVPAAGRSLAGTRLAEARFRYSDVDFG